MNNKILNCLICVVIIIVLLCIVIKNETEHFDVLESAGSGYSNEYNYKIPKFINSIISKIDGTILNVEVVKSNANNNDKTIEIIIDNYGSRLCMEDKTHNLQKCDVAKYWELKYVNNSVKMADILSNSSLGQSLTLVNYPFFMIVTPDNSLALQYNNGRFSVGPTGNYDSQKWDVSDYILPEQQLFVNDIYDGPLDKMPYSKTSDPNDRVKINLNIGDAKLKELLGTEGTGSEGTDSSSQCDTFVPKQAVENVCSASSS
jgi:hypothetical protein